MGSCFRPSRLDPATGKRVKYERYRLVWYDEHGRRCSEMAYSDYAASRAMLDRKEREVARRKEGLAVANVEKLALAAAELVEAYCAELVSRGSEPQGSYVKESRRLLTVTFAACHWRVLGDVRKDALSRHLATLAARGKAPGTRGRVLAACKALSRWCLSLGWLAQDPLSGMTPPRVGEAGKRRRRRAYTKEEFGRLLAVVPRRRANLYRLATFSGYRRKELAQMQKRDLNPTGDRPVWQLRAACAKNRHLDTVPILPDALPLVREVWEGLPTPTTPILYSSALPSAMPSHHTLNADLARAGIAKVDAEGRHVDFHSFRYTFCKFCSDVYPIQVVKVLMRHKDIRLTANLYAALGIEEAGDRVWALPRLLGNG